MPQQPYLQDQREKLTDETDSFGHRDYATALVHALTHAAPPFTVGLFGAWGLGKSTILGEVENRLKDEGTTYVYFDAWRYEGEAFRREFLKDVARRLQEKGALDEKFDREKELRDFYATVSTPEDQVVISKAHTLRALVGGGLLLLVIYAFGLLAIDKLLEPKEPSDPPVIAFLALVPLLLFLINRTTDIIQIRQHVVTQQKLEEPERFTEKFGALLRAVTAKRLVIAVDNLDRLSADDAVALLSTVKTYLEPVIEDEDEADRGEVIFLIAADDAALREHLMTRAPQVLDAGRGDGADRQRAERYADEYLRKFFNASLGLRPVLDDDIREYMRKHLEAFASRWGQPGQLDDLVRVCSVGLRHNPRRVKQFVNNMELRLQLIKAREKSSEDHVSKIEPPISTELVTVAKLALIEEEWPERFEQIRRRPGLFHEWHRAAASNQTPEEWSTSQKDWEEFAAFLSGSAYVAVPTLRPFLRLKRTQAEAELLGYDEFHDALTSRTRDKDLDKLLQTVGAAHAAKYAARVPHVVEEELRAGNLAGAVSAVNAMLTVPGLASHPVDIARTLQFAAHQPDLREGMKQVDPVPLVHAALAACSHAEADAIIAVLIDKFANAVDEDSAGTKSEGRLTRALAGAANQLSGLQARRLSDAIGEERRARLFASYLPIIQARPNLVSPSVGAAAVSAVSDKAAKTGYPLRKAGPAWEVLKIALAEGVVEEQDPLIDHFIQALNAASGADAEPLEDILEATPHMSAASEAWARLISHLAQSQPQREAGAQGRAIQLASSLVGKVETDAAANAATEVAEMVFSNPDIGIPYVVEHAEELPDEVREHLKNQLHQILQQAGRADAADALLAVAPKEAPDLIRNAAVAMVEANNHNAVYPLMDKHGSVLSGHLSSLAEKPLSRVEHVGPSSKEADFTLLARAAGELNDQQRVRLGVAVRTLIDHPRSHGGGEIDAFFDALRSSAAGRPVLRTVLEQLLGKLGEQDVSALHRVLEIAVASEPDLTREQKQQVVERVAQGLKDQPEQGVYLAGVARSLGKLTAPQEELIVEALVSADHRQERAAVDTRIALVTAARAIASTGRMKAQKRLDAHLTHLKTGDEHDHQVRRSVLDADLPS